jgi:hypothetical protein
MSNLMHDHIIYKWLGIKKPYQFLSKVLNFIFIEYYFFFLFCSSVEIASRIAVSAMMFLYFM